jgi:hypothetical protein
MQDLWGLMPSNPDGLAAYSAAVFVVSISSRIDQIRFLTGISSPPLHFRARNDGIASSLL